MTDAELEQMMKDIRGVESQLPPIIVQHLYSLEAEAKAFSTYITVLNRKLNEVGAPPYTDTWTQLDWVRQRLDDARSGDATQLITALEGGIKRLKDTETSLRSSMQLKCIENVAKTNIKNPVLLEKLGRDSGFWTPAYEAVYELMRLAVSLRVELDKVATPEDKEHHRLQLTAIETATRCNTRESAAEQRLPTHSPSWTHAYETVYLAVQREIKLREAVLEVKKVLDGC